SGGARGTFSSYTSRRRYTCCGSSPRYIAADSCATRRGGGRSDLRIAYRFLLSHSVLGAEEMIFFRAFSAFFRGSNTSRPQPVQRRRKSMPTRSTSQRRAPQGCSFFISSTSPG